MADRTKAKNQARHWLRQLDIDPDEVAKLWPVLAVGASGRHKHPPVDQLLVGLELFVRAVQHDYDGRKRPALTRKKAILWFAELAYRPERYAARDAKAFASYLEKELRRSGLNKMPDEKLRPLPPGIKVGRGIVMVPPKKYFSV